ncbi:AAA family ATPase [Photobacterium toruni]|uniref:AAA family ATPase n=1 Tax=Photobacterium toruni TaxID=1935446 RepID=UPI00210F4F17|nr:AAA family ATPase [Photobacterium toruni]
MIKGIELNNYKLFSKQEFKFNTEFNIIIGVNGSGKTSLLRGLATALAGWAHAYVKDDRNLRPIEDNEIRLIETDGRYDLAKETSIKAYGEFPIINRYSTSTMADVVWIRSRIEGDKNTNISGGIRYLNTYDRIYSDTEYNLNISTLGSDILRYVESGQDFDLPLIAFYECDRLWLVKSDLDMMESVRKRYSRFEPYLDCFHTGVDVKEIAEWLLKLELIEIQQQVENPIKKSIEDAAKSAIDGCTGFKFDFESSRVMVSFVGGKSIPFEHLSDGQRTIVCLFCDIARRAAILNPHIKENINARINGVVLVDELDLHLHPRWQRNIVKNLRETFPNIQFICTTHSPFIIQSIRNSEELIMLDGEPLSNYSNRGIEEILINMGVKRPDVSSEYEEMKELAKSYLQQIEDLDLSPRQNLEEFKKRLAKDIAPYADNPAYQAFIELKFAAKTGEEL